MNKEEILASLNDEQKKACTSTDGNIRLVAGAGSGKTNTLTKRVAYICEDKGITPDRVLCITFTNKAAGEMKDRLSSLMGVDTDALSVGTFHSLALDIIKEDAKEVLNWKDAPIIGQMPVRFAVQDFLKNHPDLFNGYSSEDVKFAEDSLTRYCESMVSKGTYDAAVLDNNSELPSMVSFDELLSYEKEKQEKMEIVKGAKSKLTYREKKVKEGKATEADLKEIEELKKIIEENAHEHQDNSPTSTYAAGVMRNKMSYGMITFDELLSVATYMLRTYDDVREKWASKFDYVQIDEFQDTDELQLEMAKLLTNESNNLFVVGDADQSIYGFRGTSSELFVNLEEHLERPVETIMMTNNYRSTKDVLDVANTVIKLDGSRMPKDLVAQTSRESDLGLLVSDSDKTYAKKVADKIKDMLNSGVNPEEIAVLYRASSDPIAKGIYEELKAAGVVMDTDLGGNSTINKCISMVFDAIRYKETGNEAYFTSFASNLPDKFITTYSELKADFVKQMDNVGDVLNDADYVSLIDHYTEEKYTKDGKPTGSYKAYLENKQEIVEEICKLTTNWGKMTEEEKLEMYRPDATPDSKSEEEKHGVKVLTMHKSKGLEFDNVFVCGISDKTKSSISNNEDIRNEECRLHYVAYSRAKTNLYLVEESEEKASIFTNEVKDLLDDKELEKDDDWLEL